MWVSVFKQSIPTYGKHAKLFKLRLEYKKYYGHHNDYSTEDIICMWDGINECFFELQTHKEVDDRDIAYWWKDDA